jgi:hypothetical protein
VLTFNEIPVNLMIYFHCAGKSPAPEMVFVETKETAHDEGADDEKEFGNNFIWQAKAKEFGSGWKATITGHWTPRRRR